MPTMTKRYRQELAHTMDVLRTGALSARQLAARLDLCKPAAYERLRRLIGEGRVVQVGKIRIGGSGPSSAIYGPAGSV